MLLNRITDFSGSPRGKWIVLVLWLVIGGAVISLTPMLSESTSNDSLLFLPESAESKRAAEMVREEFSSDGTPAIIVFRNPAGLSEADFADGEAIFNEIVAMQQESGTNVDSVVSIYNIPQARAELVSPDSTTMMMIVSITGSVNDEPYADRIDALRDVTGEYDGAELLVKVSGPGGLITDLVSVFSELDVFLLLVTVALVLVLLLLIYRSPVIAIVPLLIVGLVFQLGGGLAAVILRELDFPISGQSSGITTVILFGAGTDYYLFIASRYREELRRRDDKHEAIQATMRGVSPAILSAGGTLVAAALLLLLADLGSYRGLGPVVAITIVVMVAAALTLIPAALAIVGRNGFWPFRPAREPDATTTRDSRLWTRIARTVLNHPARVLVTTTVALLLLATGMVFFEPSYDSLESLPSDVESVEGFAALREGFPAGSLAPTSVYVMFPDGETIFDGDNLATLDAVAASQAEIDGVVAVAGPADPFGRGDGPGVEAVSAAVETIPADIREAIETARAEGTSGPPPGTDIDPQSELGQAIGLYVTALSFASDDASVAEIQVTLSENPYSTAAMDLMPDIRDAARDSAEASGLERDAILVGGETAENADTRTANTRDTLLVLPVILLAIMLILGLLLRSVVAALYLGLTIAVTYFATLGLSVLVFKYVFGHDSVSSSVPFLLFVFLNALGVDYSIYLMSRVREEAGQLDLRHATERALVRTGGVITSAGIILAGTFAALMSLPLRDLFQFGFAVSAGVLIDTFVTRSLLVPSIVELLGKWNWWPSKGPRDEGM
ncbi:MAG TPA: MMPL family transporter [Thermomicrobiales bacterium]|nr:MMPL family transporter [Thermomicrobiales bacterium]